MAKKKAAPKKSSKPKSSSSGASGGMHPAISILIALVGIGVVGYGIFTVQDLEKTKDQSTDTLVYEKPVSIVPKTKKSKNTSDTKIEEKQNDPIVDEVEEEKPYANPLLPKYEEEKPLYFTESYDFGWPEYTKQDEIYEYELFAMSYLSDKKTPKWIAYQLNGSDLKIQPFENQSYVKDPLLKSTSASLQDYKGKGYDMVSMAYHAHFAHSTIALNESYYLSMVVPMNLWISENIWQPLQQNTSLESRKEGSLFIINGIYYSKKYKTIGEGKIGVPDYFYHIRLDVSGDQAKAFWIPNQKSTVSDLTKYEISIYELEKKLGTRFFTQAPENYRTKWFGKD